MRLDGFRKVRLLKSLPKLYACGLILNGAPLLSDFLRLAGVVLLAEQGILEFFGQLVSLALVLYFFRVIGRCFGVSIGQIVFSVGLCFLC